MARSTTCLCALFLLIPSVVMAVPSNQHLDDITDLYKSLVNDYNKEIRPFIPGRSSSLLINIDFSLTTLLDFDDLTGVLKLTSSLSMRWKDKRLEWIPSDHNNLTSIVMSANDIWTPDFVTLNAPSHDYLPGQNAKRARVNQDGQVSLQSFDHLQVGCSVDITNYPYDTQSCMIIIIPWGYGPKEVFFRINNDSSFESHVSPLFLDSSSWVVSTPDVDVETSTVFSGIKVALTFTRRFAYVIANLIIPVFVLSFLNTWVFLLPPESGERISFSVTVFLSFAVYMTILSDHMPKGSEPLAKLNYQMIIKMIYSVSILFCTIISLRIYNNTDKKPVPRYLAKVVRFLSFREFCTVRGNLVGTDNDRRASHDVDDYHNLRDTINAQFPHINSQCRPSLSRQGTMQKLAVLPEDERDKAERKMAAEKEGSPRLITWMDVGLTFDVYMFLVHNIWFLVLVVIQSQQSKVY